MGDLFWLSDEAWATIEPHLPKNQPGARRVDDRRVISGILHVLKSGCRWRDCPYAYGPRTTIYNRFNRWSRRQIWQQIFRALVERGWIDAWSPSTLPMLRRTDLPMAVKGGEDAGDWSLARRSDHKNPCAD
jgi:transposase